MKKQAIVFPANGHDVTTVHPDFTHEAECVRTLGGNVIIIDMDEIAKGNVVATGILDLEMARDYDHCEINDDDIVNYLRESNMPSVAYDQYCYFRLPGVISADLYQLMRWKLGVQLVEAALDTSDYSSGFVYPYWNHGIDQLMGIGEKVERQWWLNGELVFTVPVEGSEAMEVPEPFVQQVGEALVNYRQWRGFFVVDIVKTENSWAVGEILEGQSTPLPKDRDLSPVFSALINNDAGR